MNVIPECLLGGRADLVRFGTEFGSFVGVWCGALPVPLAIPVDVELTLYGDCAWADLSSAGTESGFELVDGANRVAALVEQIDQDHVATLRIGDGVVLFDAEGVPSPGLVGTVLRLNEVLVHVYPTGV